MPLTVPNIETAPTFDAQALMDSTDLAAIIASEYGNGVISGCLVTPSSLMTVTVASGSVLINNAVVACAGGTVTAGAASTYDRKDIVVINSSGTISITAGTPCATAGWTQAASGAPPVKPSIPANSVILAELYIASTTTTVASGNIIDKTTTVLGSVIPALGTAGQVPGVTAAGTGLTFRSMAPTALPTSTQSLTASSDNILTGGVAPFTAGDIAVGSCWEWDVQLIKTAAGTNTWSLYVRVGTTTSGTTTDTAIATFTSGTNTAAIDQSTIKVVARCTSIASGSATFACAAFAQNELTTATGLGQFASPIPGSTATCTVSTAQSIHLDVTPGSSAVMTAVTAVRRVQ